MCAGALVLARVARLVFGACDPKAGAVGSLFRMSCATAGSTTGPRSSPVCWRTSAPALLSGVVRRPAPSRRRPESGTLPGGGVSERPKEHASKACEGATPPWVQIPPPPPAKSLPYVPRGRRPQEPPPRRTPRRRARVRGLVLRDSQLVTGRGVGNRPHTRRAPANRSLLLFAVVPPVARFAGCRFRPRWRPTAWATGSAMTPGAWAWMIDLSEDRSLLITFGGTHTERLLAPYRSFQRL